MRKSRRSRPSLVWGIPLLAALTGLFLVGQTLWDRGPTITVTFSTAEGIEPGKTRVRYRNVDIGDVRAVSLTPDHHQVLVTIELVRDAASFAVADSRFWVVRPRLAGTGISGLGTLLSGSYIGVDAGRAGERRTSFTGEEEPPVVASDVPGRRYNLRTADIGSLDIGSPVFFRRIQVGHVESFALDADGRNITLGIFVKAPYDHLVTDDSRFWHASGVDLRMDASGLKLETQSLATILLGGVAFETPPADGEARPADPGHQFALAATHTEAVKTADGEALSLVLHFSQGIRGLVAGAPVDFRGLEIGQVRSVSVVYDAASDSFVAPVVVDVYPDRLKMNDPSAASAMTGERRKAILASMVQRGLRAQLRSGNLLTGQLYVALDFFPEAPPARLDLHQTPLELPTVAGDLEELQQQVQSILRKLDKVPFDTLGNDTHRVMVGLEATLGRLETLSRQTEKDVLPELRDTLRELRKTVEATQETMAGDAPLQQESRQALRALGEAARSLKSLGDSLERRPESLIRGKKDSN